jgi:hypothetical protein
LISPKRIATRFVPVAVAVALVGSLLVGCETFSFLKKKQESRWTVSLHLKANEIHGENLSVLRVSNLDGDDTYLIRRIPLADASHFLQGEPIKKDGKVVAVKFTVDPYQRLKWLTMTTQYGGQKVAVCLDGYFRFFWRVPRRFNDKTCEIIIDGPWDPREAELVCKWAPINYENR